MARFAAALVTAATTAARTGPVATEPGELAAVPRRPRMWGCRVSYKLRMLQCNLAYPKTEVAYFSGLLRAEEFVTCAGSSRVGAGETNSISCVRSPGESAPMTESGPERHISHTTGRAWAHSATESGCVRLSTLWLSCVSVAKVVCRCASYAHRRGWTRYRASSTSWRARVVATPSQRPPEVATSRRSVPPDQQRRAPPLSALG